MCAGIGGELDDDRAENARALAWLATSLGTLPELADIELDLAFHFMEAMEEARAANSICQSLRCQTRAAC